jgi:hypothetical protein
LSVCGAGTAGAVGAAGAGSRVTVELEELFDFTEPVELTITPGLCGADRCATGCATGCGVWSAVIAVVCALVASTDRVAASFALLMFGNAWALA